MYHVHSGLAGNIVCFISITSLIYGIISAWCLWMSAKAGKSMNTSHIFRIAMYVAFGITYLISHANN